MPKGPRHQDFQQRGQALLPELSLPRPGLHGKNGENDDEALWTMMNHDILEVANPIFRRTQQDTNQCHGVDQQEFYPALLEFC